MVALDVDGVVNDLSGRWLEDDDYEVAVIVSQGYRLHIPTYMPALVRGLVEAAEVWWLTTWCHNANLDIPRHLGIAPLPVIDDGGSEGLAWKELEAWPLFAGARAAGRSVYWIEDFDGRQPRVPGGVVLVDTTDRWVLHPDHLPVDLRP